jgi:hypothetical protein
LALLALGTRRRGGSFRWVSVYGLHSVAEIAFYAWLFTGVADQSYVSSLYSLYPLFVVGLAASFDPARALGGGTGLPARISSWLGCGLTAVVLLANAAGVGAYLRTYKGPEYIRTHAEFRELGRALREHGFNPQKDRVMIQRTWDLYDADPLPIVRLPDESLKRIVAAAKRFGVTWLLIPDEPDEIARRSITRPFRLTLYEALKDQQNFWVAFRDDKLKLSAVRMRQ